MKRIILWIYCKDEQCESIREKVKALLKSLGLIHNFVEVSDMVSLTYDAK